MFYLDLLITTGTHLLWLIGVLSFYAPLVPIPAPKDYYVFQMWQGFLHSHCQNYFCSVMHQYTIAWVELLLRHRSMQQCANKLFLGWLMCSCSSLNMHLEQLPDFISKPYQIASGNFSFSHMAIRLIQYHQEAWQCLRTREGQLIRDRDIFEFQTIIFADSTSS